MLNNWEVGQLNRKLLGLVSAWVFDKDILWYMQMPYSKLNVCNGDYRTYATHSELQHMYQPFNWRMSLLSESGLQKDTYIYIDQSSVVS